MTMYKALKCRFTGHVFVDSRSQAGVKVCARCRHRQAFEGLTPTPAGPVTPRSDGRPTDPGPAVRRSAPDPTGKP
jgi:hypothetical protein